jgi:hypothetical protein
MILVNEINAFCHLFREREALIKEGEFSLSLRLKNGEFYYELKLLCKE